MTDPGIVELVGKRRDEAHRELIGYIVKNHFVPPGPRGRRCLDEWNALGSERQAELLEEYRKPDRTCPHCGGVIESEEDEDE